MPNNFSITVELEKVPLHLKFKEPLICDYAFLLHEVHPYFYFLHPSIDALTAQFPIFLWTIK